MHEESLRMMTDMLTGLGLEKALVLDVGSFAVPAATGRSSMSWDGNISGLT